MKDVQPPQMAMSNCDDVEQWMVTLTSPALKFDFLLRHNVGVLDVDSKFGGEDRSWIIPCRNGAQPQLAEENTVRVLTIDMVN